MAPSAWRGPGAAQVRRARSLTFRRPLPAPQGAAGGVLAANALLSLSAFGLVGLLGRAARLKTLLVAVPLVALAASLALWRLSALSAVSADGEVGRVARGALLVIALVSAAAPIVPLALVPANAEPSRLGRGYGIVESVFEGAEASLSLLLGLCRSAGGFPLALLLLSGSFGLAALVGVPLARIAREQPADPRVRASPTECWPRLRRVRFSDGGGGGGADAAGPAETRGQSEGDYVKLRADV